MEKEKLELLNELFGLGCCNVCCLRYLCDKTLDFSELEDYLEKNNLLSWHAGTAEDGKKSKANPCTVCLGMLQQTGVDQIVQLPELKKIQDYDCKTFTCAVCMPSCISIREHSMRLYLEAKYPLLFTDDYKEIPLNRVWKMIVKKPLAKLLNKSYETSDTCPLILTIFMEYEDNIKECEVLAKMQPRIFRDRSNKFKENIEEIYSRKGVLNFLSLIPSGVFKMHGSIPSTVPSYAVNKYSAQIAHDSIFFAGRYCKFSRNLSQTPWIINGKKTMETSVQELLFESLQNMYPNRLDQLIFSSSGREDCDVRCLGKGRPFYIEVKDPHLTQFTFANFRAMEDTINRSDMIQVTDLQLVRKSDLNKIKEGEENKSKSYTALCVLKNPVTIEQIEKLNSLGSLTLQQKTPIRVLHRRPVAVRQRTVHEVSANKVSNYPNLFTINLKTQAGTYVKEFVHGDFQRTKPNLCEVLQCDVDIMALDVTAIDLDWPKPVDYKRTL